jgi:hypothetical protein
MADGQGSAAGAGNPAGGEGAGAGGAAQGAWFDSIPDTDLKGWVQNKGFKDVATAVESHRNLEKLIGHDRAGRTVVVPQKWDDPNEVGQFYDKIGRPKAPDGYKLPEGADKEFGTWAQTTFHEAGLTDRQAALVMEKWGGLVAGKTEATAAAKAAALTADKEALGKEWGAAHDAKIQTAKSAVAAFGFDAATIDKLEDSLGYAGLMKFMAGLGEKVGEARAVNGDGSSPGGAMTPASAQAQIRELKADPEFTRKYLNGDFEAKQKLEQLHKWAYPEGS